jgi:hypothetical protein
LSLPFPSAATLLASSSNYQTLVGLPGNPTSAFDTIHWPYSDLTTEPPPLPYALIADYDALNQDQERWSFAESGDLLLQLFALPDPTYTDPRDQITNWRNICGAILIDMLTNARNTIPDTDPAQTYWGLTKWAKHNTPQPVQASDCDLQLVDGNGNPIESFFFAGFVLSWNT